MYRLLVCFKISYDYDQLALSEWNTGGFLPDTDYLRRVLGCFDESALENGLRIRDHFAEQNKETELCALCVNPGYSDHIINRLFASGYDRVICIGTIRKEKNNTDVLNLDFFPELTAYVIKTYLERYEFKPDCIICGEQSPPGNSGLVPVWLGEILGRDIIVSGGADQLYLRIPTLKEKLAAKSKQPEKIIFFEKDIFNKFYRIDGEKISKKDFVALNSGSLKWTGFENKHVKRAGKMLEKEDIYNIVSKITDEQMKTSGNVPDIPDKFCRLTKPQ